MCLRDGFTNYYKQHSGAVFIRVWQIVVTTTNWQRPGGLQAELG